MPEKLQLPLPWPRLPVLVFGPSGNSGGAGETSFARVLIVEDQLFVGMAMSQTLADLGYDVSGLASTAAEAVAMAKLYRPQIVLMDISLGDGPDGIEAAEQIAALIDVRVLFVTAHTDPQTLERVHRSGLGQVLAKPFTDEQLATALARAVA